MGKTQLDELKESVRKGIQAALKKDRTPLGPNTKKLIKTDDPTTFTKTINKKNWVGTSVVHAAAIIFNGAVVANSTDENQLKRTINTLKTATQFSALSPLVARLRDSDTVKKLETVVEKHKATLFKQIKSIAKYIPEKLLEHSEGTEPPAKTNDTNTMETIESNAMETIESNATAKTSFTKMLTDVTYACEQTLKKDYLQPDAKNKVLKSNLSQDAIKTYTEMLATDIESLLADLVKYTKCNTKNNQTFNHAMKLFIQQYQNSTSPTTTLISAATTGITKKTTKTKITKIFEKIKSTLDPLLDYQESLLTLTPKPNT